MSRRFATSALTLAIALGLSHGRARADIVTDWNQIAIQSTKDAALTPGPATRALAIVHASVYDATTAIEKKYEPYHAELEAPDAAIPEVAAAAAAHYALTVLFPTQKTALNAKLNAVLSKFPKGAARDASRQLGVDAAADILSLRAAGIDGSIAVVPYLGATTLGAWRPTLPTNAAAQDPQWADVTPFVITAPDAFRPVAPPDPITSTAYATAFEEVRALGDKNSTTRTATQTEIAKFWIFPTHLAYNAIARQLSNARGFSLYDNARLFAVLEIALADSRVATWDAKYTYGFWRPITSITGDVGGVTGTDDGNVGTTEDAAWLPLLDTPAHPEYPSGHSATGAAGATVLAAFFGEESGFTVSSESLADTTRAFATLWSSALENGRSRIYGGIHYQFSNAAGLTLGKSVGQYAVDHLFEALPEPPPAVADAGTDASVEEDDAGVVADASVAPEPDASVAQDAAAAEVDSSTPAEDAGDGFVADASDEHDHDKKKDDGCSVADVGGAGSLSPAFGLLLAGLVMLRRRRK